MGRRPTTTPRSKNEKDNTRQSASTSPRYVRFRNNRKIELKEKTDIKDENKPIRKPFRRMDVTPRKVDSNPLSSRQNRFSLRRKLTRGGSSRPEITPSTLKKEIRTTTETAHIKVVENKLSEEQAQLSEILTTKDSSSTDTLPNVKDAASTAILPPAIQEITNTPSRVITDRPLPEDSESTSENKEKTETQSENVDNISISDNSKSEIDNSGVTNFQESSHFVEMTTEQHEVKVEIITERTFSLNTNAVKTIPTITAKRITIKPSVTELQDEKSSEIHSTTENTLPIAPDNSFSNRGTVRASTNRGRIPSRKTSKTRGSSRKAPRGEMGANSQAKDDIEVIEKTEAPIKIENEQFPLEKGPVKDIEDEEFLHESRDESSTKRTPQRRNEVTTSAPEPFVLKVAPEDPRDAINRGGLKFPPHDDSERDLKRSRNGEVIVTQIGTLENTPPHQVESILSGLGGRRRGLARPSKKQRITTTTTEDPRYLDYNIDDYYIYDDDY